MVALILLSLAALASASAIPPTQNAPVIQRPQLIALPPDPWKDIQGAKAQAPFVTKDLKAVLFHKQPVNKPSGVRSLSKQQM